MIPAVSASAATGWQQICHSGRLVQREVKGHWSKDADKRIGTMHYVILLDSMFWSGRKNSTEYFSEDVAVFFFFFVAS